MAAKGNHDDREGQHETLVMIDNVLYEGGNDSGNQHPDNDYEPTGIPENAVGKVPNAAARTFHVVTSNLPASDAGDYTTLKAGGNSQQDGCTKADFDKTERGKKRGSNLLMATNVQVSRG
ncbi:hypothetical protein BaRGS_00031944 [Batillaria attramentaria]|uniref:Uncharacterized protein n=1 Tax=Batillaria attramentaria TaxID=370345 RepID=A0ABD0JPT1_9CAEN